VADRRPAWLGAVAVSIAALLRHLPTRAFAAFCLAIAVCPAEAAQVSDPLAGIEAEARVALAASRPGSEERVVAQLMLATLLQSRGRFQEAEPLLRDAQALSIRREGIDSAVAAFISSRLALQLFVLDQAEVAEPLLRRAATILSAARDAPPPFVAMVLLDHGLVLAHLGRHGEAEAQLRRGVALVDTGAVDARPALPGALLALGTALRARGQAAEAEPILRRALALHEVQFGRDHYATRVALVAVGAALRELGREAEAEPLLRRAVYAHAVTGVWDNFAAISAAAAMGQVTRRRNPAEARVFYARAALGAQRRIAQYRAHGPAAQAELRSFAPIFAGQVEAAWWMGVRK
jgi:tetratricopeptide (TPR) repeat protein